MRNELNNNASRASFFLDCIGKSSRHLDDLTHALTGNRGAFHVFGRPDCPRGFDSLLDIRSVSIHLLNGTSTSQDLLHRN